MSIKTQVVMSLGAFCLGCALYAFWDFLHQLESPSHREQYCELSTQVCIQNQVAMSLSSDTVQPLIKTTIQVYWINTTARSLKLTLQGVEENLGTVTVSLKPKSSMPTERVFTGELMLPVCSGQGITWKGMLTDGTKRVYPLIRMEP